MQADEDAEDDCNQDNGYAERVLDAASPISTELRDETNSRSQEVYTPEPENFVKDCPEEQYTVTGTVDPSYVSQSL